MLKTNENIDLVKNIDINNHTTELVDKYKNSPEVEALTSKINVEDPNTVLTFGKEASDGLSSISDQLLSTIRTSDIEKSSELIVQLTKIMDRFDIDDFKNQKEPTILQKLFSKAKSSIELILKKYDTMGGEVEKIYVELKKYEVEIQKSNENLNLMFNSNMDFYDNLQKYICAGEMALNELDNDLLPSFKKNVETTQDQMAILDYQQLCHIREMVEQRVYDLRMAENIALQTVPMLRAMQLGNYNLIRKINSAFVITLPIFKQCLVQAVMIKKQELQAKSLKALDDKTNELLLKNATNVMNQTTLLTKMAGTSSINIETLEKTWSTILNGIQETKQIQEENKKQRQCDTAKLKQLKDNAKQLKNMI